MDGILHTSRIYVISVCSMRIDLYILYLCDANVLSLPPLYACPFLFFQFSIGGDVDVFTSSYNRRKCLTYR
uniref:Uncharacterized protein n=1 Tax=Daphnia magna TaxID=35525 RepID=A0A0P6IZI2_9CRUS